MKKFAKVMAVALVAVMALALLVACGPASDPQKALDALKKNGYTTTGSSIAADNAVSKAACDAQGLALGVKSGELIAMISGTKLVEKEDDVDGEMVVIYYFSSSAAAKTAWEGTYIKNMRSEAEKSDDDNAVIKLSGSMIYLGTKDGVKAAR